MPNFKGIIFDMDGTLLDSEIVWERAEAEMFAARGLDYGDDVRERVIGLRLDAFFRTLIDIYQLEESVEALSQDLIARMHTKIPDLVKPKPGAQALIEWAAAQQLPYCIASSSPQSIIDAAVEAVGWGDLIPLRYSADAVPHGKPAPDVYLYAAQQLGLAPQDCLALEDSTTGAKAAVAAGMTTYAVPDFHTAPEKFAAITPHVFKDLGAVLAALRGSEA